MTDNIFEIPTVIGNSRITWGGLHYSNKIYDLRCETIDDIPLQFNDNSSNVSALTFRVILYALKYKFFYLIHFEKGIDVAQSIVEKLNSKLIESNINLNFYFHKQTLYYSTSGANPFDFYFFEGKSFGSVRSDINKTKKDKNISVRFNPLTGNLEMEKQERPETFQEELEKSNIDTPIKEVVFEPLPHQYEPRDFKNDEFLDEVTFNIKSGSLEVNKARLSDSIKNELINIYGQQSFIKNQFKCDESQMMCFSTLTDPILYIDKDNEFIFNLRLYLFKQDQTSSYLEKNVFKRIHLNTIDFDSKITMEDSDPMYHDTVNYLGVLFTNYPTATKFKDLVLELKQLM